MSLVTTSAGHDVRWVSRRLYYTTEYDHLCIVAHVARVGMTTVHIAITKTLVGWCDLDPFERGHRQYIDIVRRVAL